MQRAGVWGLSAELVSDGSGSGTAMDGLVGFGIESSLPRSRTWSWQWQLRRAAAIDDLRQAWNLEVGSRKAEAGRWPWLWPARARYEVKD